MWLDIEITTLLWFFTSQPYSNIKLHILSLYNYSHPHSHPQGPTVTLDLEYLGFYLTLASTSTPAIVSYSHAGAINRTLSSLGQGLPHPARPPVRTWNPASEPQLRVVTAGRFYKVEASLSPWASQQHPLLGSLWDWLSWWTIFLIIQSCSPHTILPRICHQL